MQTSSTTGGVASQSAQVFLCKICDVKCTGVVSYQSHIEGRPHFKRLHVSRQELDEGGSPSKKMKTSGVEIFRCDTCNVELLCKTNYDDHLKGAKHMKRVEALKAEDPALNVPYIEKSGSGYKCTLCGADNISSPTVVASHVEGVKHKRRLANGSSPKPTSKPTVSSSTSDSNQAPSSQGVHKIVCDICNIFVNTEAQLDIHRSSLKHRHKAESVAKSSTSKTQTGTTYDAWDPSN